MVFFNFTIKSLPVLNICASLTEKAPKLQQEIKVFFCCFVVFFLVLNYSRRVARQYKSRENALRCIISEFFRSVYTCHLQKCLMILLPKPTRTCTQQLRFPILFETGPSQPFLSSACPFLTIFSSQILYKSDHTTTNKPVS